MSNLFRDEAMEHATRRLAGEVVLVSPLSIRLFAALLVGAVAAALTFASLATYTRKEMVTGWVAPSGGLIRVTARAGGIVEKIVVQEGDSVSDGAKLAILRLSTDAARGDTGQALVSGLNAERAASQSQAAASMAKLEVQRKEMEARVALLQSQLEETVARITILEQRKALADDQASRGKALAARGFLSKSSMDTLNSNALSAAQDVSNVRSVAIDLRRQISDLTHEIKAVPADLAGLKAQAAATAASLDQKRVTVDSQIEFVATAPLPGRVVAIPVETGQAVPAGGAVAVLTPSGSDLIAEVYVPSRAVGFIRIGQDVRLQYQAFPYQTFGVGHGTITTISRTVLAPSEVAIPGLTVAEPVFRVRVKLESPGVNAYGRFVRLQPGMLLTADIITDRRTLLEWLLDPLYAVGRRV